MKSNNTNNKALNILLNYNMLKPEATSREDLEYAKSAGYMFDNVIQTHDQAIEIAFNELNKCDRGQITNLFLASLSTHNLEWRIGLPAFAIMYAFPKHTFTQYENQDWTQENCKICGSWRSQEVDRNFINQTRFSCGGIVGYDIYDFAFLLAEHNKLSDIKPTENDFRIFNDIISLITRSSDDEKPNTLQKKLRTIEGFKSNEEERRCLLETLGFCSILESEKHKGFLSAFTNLSLSPSNGRSSDWRYPVDWWKGRDGINKTAFEFWFGGYKALRNI